MVISQRNIKHKGSLKMLEVVRLLESQELEMNRRAVPVTTRTIL